MHRLKSLALVGILALAVAGCQGHTGDAARDKALLPAMRLAWPAVESDVLRGLNDAVQDGDLDPGLATDMAMDADAIEAALADSLPVAREVTGQEWPPLHTFALRGVDDRVEDGEIGAGVGDSFRERIKQFDDSVTKLQGR